MDRVQELSASPKFIDANKHRYSHYVEAICPTHNHDAKRKENTISTQGERGDTNETTSSSICNQESGTPSNDETAYNWATCHMTPDTFHISERANTVAGLLPSRKPQAASRSIGHKARLQGIQLD